MAIIYTNSFRFLPNAYDPVLVGSGYTARLAGRFPGGYAYGTTSAVTVVGNRVVTVKPTTAVNMASWSLGFASYATTSARTIQFGTGGTYTDTLTMPLGGAPVATTVASSTSAWTIHDPTPVPNGWQWFCVQAIGNSAAAGFFKVYLNGTLIASKGPDTLPASSYENAFGVGIGAAVAGQEGAIGDLVVSDDPNYLIPDSRVDMLLPNADVGTVWTPSTGTSLFPLVADSGGPSLNADYISSGTVDAHQQFDLENLPHNPSTVRAVATVASTAKSDAGARSMTVTLNGVDGTAIDSGLQDWRRRVYETNPSGGAVWDASSVNAARVGVKVVT
jgi:hypothetical protein